MRSESSSSVEPGAEKTCPSVASTSGPPAAHETFASGTSDGKDGKALLEVAAKGLEMHTGDGLDRGAARGIEVPERDEMVGQRSALVASPGGECREQRPLVDQAVLEGQQAEEQVARGVGRLGHGGGSHSIEGGTVLLEPGRAGTHRL